MKSGNIVDPFNHPVSSRRFTVAGVEEVATSRVRCQWVWSLSDMEGRVEGLKTTNTGSDSEFTQARSVLENFV